MKLIEEHLDIGVEIWTKKSSGYTHKDESIPCRIIGFNTTKFAVMIDNQLSGHLGAKEYYYDKQGNSLGEYNGEGITDRRYMSISDIERIAYPDLSKFIGRKIKLLRDRPYGGDVKAGEIGTIRNSSSINFPSQSGYSATNLFYEKRFLDAFELLPEDYVEEQEEVYKYSDGKPLVDVKPGWYINKTYNSPKKYVRIVSREIRGTINNAYQLVYYDAFTDDFINIESVDKKYWANESVNRSLIKISDEEIEEIKKKNIISASVKMYDANTPPKGAYIAGFDPSTDNTKECRLQTLELKSWQPEILEEVFDYTKIFKKEENLLDKYEHQVIKLSKPRTKNKLIIL